MWLVPAFEKHNFALSEVCFLFLDIVIEGFRAETIIFSIVKSTESLFNLKNAIK